MIDHVIDKFSQHDTHLVDTPMVPGMVLERPNKSLLLSSHIAAWIEHTPFQELIRSLMYITIGTRPNIAFAISKLSMFLDCYHPDHWEAGIRVLHYLKGTCSLSLALGSSHPLNLKGFSDSDYASCITTSQSILGYCFSLGSDVMSWSS
jgi:hypothetical protein